MKVKVFSLKNTKSEGKKKFLQRHTALKFISENFSKFRRLGEHQTNAQEKGGEKNEESQVDLR